MIATSRPGGLVDVGLMERLGMVVALAVGHSGVAIAEHLDLVVPDERRRRRQLQRTQLGEQRLLGVRRQPVERPTRFTQRRVLQVAFLTAGAAHEHGVDVLGVVLGDRRRPLRRLVIGVGVDTEQREPVLHDDSG